MASTNGQLRTCDRCGKTIFLETIGDGEADGGFTRWNKFEEAPGWSREYNIGDLCPECKRQYDIMIDEFKSKLKTEGFKEV